MTLSFLTYIAFFFPRQLEFIIQSNLLEDILVGQVRMAYERGLISDLKDVERMREIASVEQPTVAQVALSTVLKRWMFDILKRWENVSAEELQTEYEFVGFLLEKEEAERPFSILPDKEQALATKLRDCIEKGDEDKQESFALLSELTTSLGTKIQVKEEEVRSTRRWGVYSTGFGATGVLLFLLGYLPRLSRWVRSKYGQLEERAPE